MSLVKEAFEKHARTVRRGFGRDREKTVGASEIGQCARKVWYLKHDGEHDPGHIDGWGAARRGSTFETRFFVPALRKHYGAKLLFAGGKQKRLVDKQLSATPDGLLIDQPRDLLAGLMVPDIGPSKSVVVEAKTVDPRINLSEPKMPHVFQVMVQLGLFRKLTKYKPDFGVIVYTNASFFDDIVEFVVKFDPEIFANAERRANRIMISSTAADMKPEGWIKGGDECKYCPFTKACGSIRGGVPANDKVADDPQFIAELIDLAQQEREAKVICEQSDEDHKELQEKIKVHLRRKGLRFVRTSEMNVSWATVKGRPSYDWPGIKAAAAAAGVDLQSYETVGDPSDRLNVTVIGRDRLVKNK
jgi:CRISPR/Cas system-associated exonuclease Cas4 (RecB family)